MKNQKVNFPRNDIKGSHLGAKSDLFMRILLTFLKPNLNGIITAARSKMTLPARSHIPEV